MSGFTSCFTFFWESQDCWPRPDLMHLCLTPCCAVSLQVCLVHVISSGYLYLFHPVFLSVGCQCYSIFSACVPLWIIPCSLMDFLTMFLSSSRYVPWFVLAAFPLVCISLAFYSSPVFTFPSQLYIHQTYTLFVVLLGPNILGYYHFCFKIYLSGGLLNYFSVVWFQMDIYFWFTLTFFLCYLGKMSKPCWYFSQLRIVALWLVCANEWCFLSLHNIFQWLLLGTII